MWNSINEIERTLEEFFSWDVFWDCVGNYVSRSRARTGKESWKYYGIEKQ